MKNELVIRDEEILLLGLSRLMFSTELTGRLKELALKNIDWDYFCRLAGDHGIAALAHHNLENLGLLQLLPEKNSSELRNSLMLSLSRNAFHLSATEELLGLLNSKNIKVVLLKGLALEKTVYGNQGLRQMTDVDILIDREDFISARNILMSNGYDSLPVKSGFHRPIIQWTGKHLPSLLKNGTSVDIHLELFAGRRNGLTRLLIDGSSEISLDREKAFVPSPLLNFLFLVKHLHQHEMNNESQLRLYTDLAVLTEHYHDEIVCYDLLKYASQAGLSRILAWKLEALRDLWGMPFPGWINDFIDRWFNPDSINKFVFFLKSPKGNRPENRGQAYRSNLREIPGLHRKILFILGDIFPTLTFMKERYGCNNGLAASLRYPLRFGKLLWLFRR